LKAGLEIHQQLDTGKLFSRTPSLLRSEKPDYEIKRRLHKVAGETGETDTAVEYEAGLDKEFVYQGYNDTISLVELDEEPPYSMDEDALNEALRVALLLNCEIYPIAQIMRKTVIDGSNTSGFQRTVLIGHDGFVEIGFGKIGIESVALEEDAARLIERGKEKVVFRLDRLGIPLVEIGTKPELDTPEKIKETALKIGEILRACKVKRGIGTIRQDINVSIRGHDRVEIKGFQEPKMMIKTIELEIERQQEDLKKGKKEGDVRNALPDGKTEFLRPIPGGARMYPETDLSLLRISRERLNLLKKNLPKLKQDIKDELRKKGLSEEMIVLVLDGNLDEFDVLMKVYNKDANLVGKMISLWRQELGRKKGKSFDEVKEILNERILEKILEKVKSGELDKGHVKEVLLNVLEGENIDKAVKVEKISNDEIEEEIRKIVKEKPGLRANAYMGLIMGKLKGKVDAKKAMEIVNRIVK
jgi:Glu-tRNA(Gln) amidotransferase subunit E-like FAD-binding protein